MSKFLNTQSATPKTRTPSTRTPSARTRPLLAACGVAAVAALTLSGCTAFGPGWAVTYEIEAVDTSGAAGAWSSAVQYLDRDTGLDSQSSTGETVQGSEFPAQFETIGKVGEEVSVSAAGVPGVTLRCAVLLDGERLIEEQTGAEGEGVTCTVTTPESIDD
ncbi:hypothetical protein [Humidisolicoccus flavus]|uniref:hypothetical protein n=1 Tax=Humidisolicoccus flavus TaxID=3111414 RepID=UPI00324D4ED7